MILDDEAKVIDCNESDEHRQQCKETICGSTLYLE